MERHQEFRPDSYFEMTRHRGAALNFDLAFNPTVGMPQYFSNQAPSYPTPAFSPTNGMIGMSYSQPITTPASIMPSSNKRTRDCDQDQEIADNEVQNPSKKARVDSVDCTAVSQVSLLMRLAVDLCLFEQQQTDAQILFPDVDITSKFDTEVLDQTSTISVHIKTKSAVCAAVSELKRALERDMVHATLPDDLKQLMVCETAKSSFRRQVQSWNTSMMNKEKIKSTGASAGAKGIVADLLKQERVLGILYERLFPQLSSQSPASLKWKEVIVRNRQCDVLNEWASTWKAKILNASYTIDENDFNPRIFDAEGRDSVEVVAEINNNSSSHVSSQVSPQDSTIGNDSPETNQAAQVVVKKTEDQRTADGRYDVFKDKPSSQKGHLVSDSTPMEDVFESYPNHLTLHRVAIRMARENWPVRTVADILKKHKIIDNRKEELEGKIGGPKTGLYRWVKSQREKAAHHVDNAKKAEKRRQGKTAQSAAEEQEDLGSEEHTPAAITPAPLNIAPVAEAPVENNPINLTPINADPVDQFPVLNTPINQPLLDHTLIHENSIVYPVDNTVYPVDNTPFDGNLVNNTPIDYAAIDLATVNHNPFVQYAVNQAPTTNDSVDPAMAYYDFFNNDVAGYGQFSQTWIEDPDMDQYLGSNQG